MIRIQNILVAVDFTKPSLYAARYVEKARQFGVDVIVMTSQDHKGWRRFFKKNIIEQVIRNAPCSVFVARLPEGKADV